MNNSFRSQLAFLSGYVQTTDGRRFSQHSVPEPYRQVIADYALIQYDILFGKQHAVELFRESEGE